MTIEVSSEVGARLRARALAEGISLSEYLERLICEEESRRVKSDAFQQAMDERVASLRAGEIVDGEEVMARLIAELDVTGKNPALL
jgi:predicted transcriptional regulator